MNLYILNWNLSEQIGALTLVVLVLTLAWSIVIEAIKLRRRIKFLQISECFSRDKPHSIASYTVVIFEVANNCRRPIQLGYKYMVTKDHFKSKLEEVRGDPYLQETQPVSVEHTVWGKTFKVEDIYYIGLVDSVGKHHRGYMYAGKFSNRWVVWIRRTTDRYFQLLGI